MVTGKPGRYPDEGRRQLGSLGCISMAGETGVLLKELTTGCDERSALNG